MATPQQTIDRVGGWLSLLCAIHCAVVPALLVLASLGAPIVETLGIFDDERYELGFSIIALVLVVVSLGLGRRGGHDRRALLLGFGVGLGLIAGSRLAPGPDWLAHLILVGGALILAYTHRRSLRGLPDRCADPPASAALLP